MPPTPIQRRILGVALHEMSIDRQAAVLTAVSRYGTPLFIYFEEDFLKQRSMLLELLPAASKLIFSVKANPNPDIIRFFYDSGMDLELASGGELDVAICAGCSSNRAIFVGPAKTDAELKQAINAGLQAIVVESLGEFARLNALPKDKNKVRILLRLDIGKFQHGTLRKAGDSPFGMSVWDAKSLLAERTSFNGIVIDGIHSHSGTQQFVPTDLTAQVQLVLETASTLQRDTGARFNFIDLGGGFAWPTRKGDPEPDWTGLAASLSHSIERYRADHPWTKTIAFESGRFLTAPGGIFVSEVQDVKAGELSTFVLTDGGISNFGFDDRYYGARAPVLGLIPTNDRPLSTVTICGPLCTPADRQAAKISLPMPQRGDLVCVFNAGAYGLTQNPGLFLGRGYAAEVMVADGQIRNIRHRFTAADFTRATCFVPLK